MGKRTAAFFAVVMLLFFIMLMRVYGISMGPTLAETADRQSTYELDIAKTRGTIYDCNKNPLVNTRHEYIAAVSPTKEAAAALTKVLPQEKMSQIYPMLTQGKPFAVKLPSGNVSAEGMDVFAVDKRYSENPIASNVIGYLNGSGEGVAGIEKAYDTQLKESQGEIKIQYKVDAVNRVLQGEDRKIENTYDKRKSGVVLTLDSEIQRKAEELARQYIQRGAVVVTEVANGKIRALASMPDYTPNDIESALKNVDSPMLNRAFSAYNVGSVYKLVSAAAALEDGISPSWEWDCKGGYEIAGDVLHCYNRESHGLVDMQEAIAKSCNAYFMDLMQQVPSERFLAMSSSLGFGKSFTFAPGYASNSGVLPDQKELELPKGLANFSFGQGSLLATPVQVAGLINAIAADGNYVQPALVEGLVDEDMEFTQKMEQAEPKRVMSEKTAKLLRQYMAASVDHGTSKKGKPLIGGAGAKTGTAETGQIIDGREIVQSWYAGFYPYDNPKYAIIVLGEDGEGGGSACAPVFKGLADWFALGE